MRVSYVGAMVYLYILSKISYLLFSGVFDVLVFIGGVVPVVLDVVLRHPVLGGGGRVGACLFLFVAGSGPTSSCHDCVCVIQYLQGSEKNVKIKLMKTYWNGYERHVI